MALPFLRTHGFPLSYLALCISFTDRPTLATTLSRCFTFSLIVRVCGEVGERPERKKTKKGFIVRSFIPWLEDQQKSFFNVFRSSSMGVFGRGQLHHSLSAIRRGWCRQVGRRGGVDLSRQ